MTQQTNKTKQQQNNNEIPKVDFPFKVKHRYGPLKIMKQGKPEPNKIIPGNSRQLLKEPIAFIIKSNYEVDIREGVKEGYIELDRNIGGSIEPVRIFNPKSKLLSFPIGGTVYRGWILDEKEAVALPTDIKHDSLVLKRIMEALMLNYEEFKTKRMKEIYKILIAAGAFVLILVFGMGIMGFNIFDIIGGPEQAAVAGQNITYIIDANTMGVI